MPAWKAQSLTSRIAASATWAATAAATIGLLLALGPSAAGHAGGTRQLLAGLPSSTTSAVPIASFAAPASAVFYAGRVAEDGCVPPLQRPADAAGFVAEHPGAHLVIDARFEAEVTAGLPPHYGVLRTAAAFPTTREFLLIGPKPTERLSATPQEPLR